MSDRADAFWERLGPVLDAIAEGAHDRDRRRRYATEHLAELGRIGFWALTVPREYGGLGLGPDAVAEAIMRLAAVDGSLGQIPQNHFNTVDRVVLTGTEEQRRRHLPLLVRGGFYGNAAAEPGDRRPGEAATTLTRTADGWSLSGRKVYATGALLADVVAVLARTPAGEQVTVLVPRDAEGVTINDDWDGFGQRTTASGSAVFQDVRVADLDVLPWPDDPRLAYRISAHAQLMHAAIDAGIAEGAAGEAVALARRVHGARGSGAARFTEDALGMAELGELHLAATTARRMVEAAAVELTGLTDTSPLPKVPAAFYAVMQAKIVSTRAALQVAQGLFDVGGAGSTRAGLGLDRYWRDARTHTLHDAVRWKPHSLGKWLAEGLVADPWSLGAPLRRLTDLVDLPEPNGSDIP
ncbi:MULTISPECIES: acyl-CoA dehydrogenase family protein [Thermomonospora]|uniref:Dibenzothiophene monooxygenase n=1 Tax=Thermomonospora curvata (strain ATCC 19995 / DSM 43183 / JCM 3096 / KCTC 9072 / NBRC 15933 / NCIMB 10081 / Henssen B9) TaxID=471852 RepID=D1AA23_THECD|nr:MULTISPECIES: acyl-CoA dehydrogenase family protein [Thermomonospora]ACY96959.1 acyl-CoA dehydrogenase domain protein [Thermomonospora curvata DSM 43183]PKK15236.1 MAG: acyl-CoA dehydrogenase [Thermomonospora sp. CIF 1]